MQCLCQKGKNWTSEAGDEDFELQAKHCFVSGISKSGVYEFDAANFQPARHGIGEENIMINNLTDIDDEDSLSAMPLHPGCWQMFKRMSISRTGEVGIDRLWRLRNEQGDYTNRFEGFPDRLDRAVVSQQWYDCVRGTEYLATDPIEPLGLRALIDECVGATDEVAFASTAVEPRDSGSFSRLSYELRNAILMLLDPKDVAALRLASASFMQLPQTYFRHLIKTAMPWFWEIDDLQGQPVDWAKLWSRLSCSDGGAGLDEQQRDFELKTLSGVRRFEAWRAEINELGIDRTNPKYMELWTQRNEEAETEADEINRKVRETGRWSTKREMTEIKGLRNRRRIWGDVEEILNRIERLAVKPEQSG